MSESLTDLGEMSELFQSAPNTVSFVTQPNEDLTIPSRYGKTVPDAPPVREDLPEADSDVVISGGDVQYIERTQESASRAFNAFSVNLLPGTDIYPGPSAPLLGEDLTRSRAFITNAGAVPILVGAQSQINSGVGFYLTPGQMFDPQVTSSIYACIPAGAVMGSATFIPVGVWVETD